MAKILFAVGHGKSDKGGYDSGAVSKDKKWHEFKIAREIAKYAQSYYNANYNEQCDLMNYNGDLNLKERIAKLQDNTYDLVAEIHLNAGGGTGTECYYYHGSQRGQKYAQEITKAISTAFGIRNRGAKTKLNKNGTDYFGFVRETKPCALLIETMFIDTSDLDKITSADGQRKCGEAIAKAIATVRGVSKKTTPPKQDYLYKVKITCDSLNIRNKPNALFSNIVGYVRRNEVYTIVDENNGWGKLKSGAGWIRIDKKYNTKI